MTRLPQRKKNCSKTPKPHPLNCRGASPRFHGRSIHSPRDLYIDPPNINMEIGWHLSFLPSTNGKRTSKFPEEIRRRNPKTGGFCRCFRNGRNGLPKRDRFVVDGLVCLFLGEVRRETPVLDLFYPP